MDFWRATSTLLAPAMWSHVGSAKSSRITVLHLVTLCGSMSHHCRLTRRQPWPVYCSWVAFLQNSRHTDSSYGPIVRALNSYSDRHHATDHISRDLEHWWQRSCKLLLMTPLNFNDAFLISNQWPLQYRHLNTWVPPSSLSDLIHSGVIEAITNGCCLWVWDWAPQQ